MITMEHIFNTTFIILSVFCLKMIIVQPQPCQELAEAGRILRSEDYKVNIPRDIFIVSKMYNNPFQDPNAPCSLFYFRANCSFLIIRGKFLKEGENILEVEGISNEGSSVIYTVKATRLINEIHAYSLEFMSPRIDGNELSESLLDPIIKRRKDSPIHVAAVLASEDKQSFVLRICARPGENDEYFIRGGFAIRPYYYPLTTNRFAATLQNDDTTMKYFRALDNFNVLVQTFQNEDDAIHAWRDVEYPVHSDL